MRFKVDENLPSELAELLREQGHDAHSVLDEHLGGSADSTLARICQEERRILISLDLDFANIRNYPPGEHCGIILLRLPNQDRKAVQEIIHRVLKLLEIETVARRLWIVDAHRTRIRGDS